MVYERKFAANIGRARNHRLADPRGRLTARRKTGDNQSTQDKSYHGFHLNSLISITLS